MKLLLVVALATLINAYEFNDELYNQLIKRDLDELQDYVDLEKFYNHRLKREEVKPEVKPVKEEVKPVAKDEEKPDSNQDKCKKKRIRMCCGEDIVEAVIDKDRDLKRECYKDVTGASKDERPFGLYDPFDCEKVNRTKREWTCVMQCVGQKKNCIDENGNIKEKEALEFKRKELAGDPWFLKLVEEAYPKCLQQVKAVNFVKDETDKLSCNPSAMKMHHCMWREIQMTCPEDKITDPKMCGRIKERLRKYDDNIFRHSPLDDYK